MKGSRWVVGFDASAAARTCANMHALDMVSERVSGTAEHKSFAQVKGSYVSPIPYAYTYSLHCSSFFGLPYRIRIIYLVKPKKELQWRL